MKSLLNMKRMSSDWQIGMWSRIGQTGGVGNVTCNLVELGCWELACFGN